MNIGNEFCLFILGKLLDIDLMFKLKRPECKFLGKLYWNPIFIHLPPEFDINTVIKSDKEMSRGYISILSNQE